MLIIMVKTAFPVILICLYCPFTLEKTASRKTDSTSLSLAAQLLIISKLITSKLQPLQMLVKVMLTVVMSSSVPVAIKSKSIFCKNFYPAQLLLFNSLQKVWIIQAVSFSDSNMGEDTC